MYIQRSSKVVFEHPRLTLIKDVISMPGGGEGTYLKEDGTPDAVTVLCMDERGTLDKWAAAKGPSGLAEYQREHNSVSVDYPAALARRPESR